jgi:preprotein translocase subunit SecD
MFRTIAVLAALALPQAAAAQGLQLHVILESQQLSPDDIVSARAILEGGRWVVELRLTPFAAAKFGIITERNIGKAMQIVVENRILSAPIILNAIKQGTVIISGDLTEALAKEMARKIKP